MFSLNQRLKQEFGKILKSDKNVQILDELMNENILEILIPEISRMKGIEQPKEFHAEGDVWEHTKMCLKNLPEKKSFQDQNEHLRLVWATLLHDVGKPQAKEVISENGSSRIHFKNHEKYSVEIAKRVLLIEKEAKKYRGEGLNEEGEKLRGLNYDLEFAQDIMWLIENHMHHIDFSKMSKVKQNKLMENRNFENLLLLWRADVFGSHPVRTENYEEAERIYSEYRENGANKIPEKKAENIIPPEELMGIFKSEGLEMEGGLLKFKNYKFFRAIPAFMEYLGNLFLENGSLEKEIAEKKIRKLLREEKILEKIQAEIESDPEISRIRQEMMNISGKKKNSRKKKLETAIGRRVNEIFDAFFEKLT